MFQRLLRLGLPLILVSVLLTGLTTTGGCGGAGGHHNLVIVVSDALRHDVLGCYGGRAETPNIDWLASHGILFENAYSPTPRTLPSAVSMFTGHHAATYPSHEERGKIVKFFVPDREELFAETLAAQGYDAVFHIENDNASLSNNLQGFRTPKNPDQLSSDQFQELETVTGFVPRNKFYKKMTGLLHYLLTVPPETKFCVVKWILDPHSAYNPPPFFKNRIRVDLSKLSQPIDLYSRSHFGGQWIKNRMVGRELSAYEIGYIKELYLREVESVDERLGYMLAALREKGLLDKTFVVFTSDHGEAFGEHDRYGHGHTYFEELLHIPLIVYGPGLEAGRRISQRVSLLGLMPTVMELLGTKPTENIQGRSFAPLLKGKPVVSGPLFFSGANLSSRYRDALILGDLKLVTFRADEAPALYDLISDPKESRRLTESEPHGWRRLLAGILAVRKQNREKLDARIRLDTRLNRMGDDERRRILDHLRTLGYID